MSWWKTRVQAGTQNDEDEVLIPPTAEQPTQPIAETQPQPAAQHPVLVTALALGIMSAAQMKDLHATALEARKDALAEAEKHCIKCFKADGAPAKMKQLETFSYAEIKERSAIWADMADEKFRMGENGAARQTVPPKTEDVAPKPAAEQPKPLSNKEIYANRENATKGGRK